MKSTLRRHWGAMFLSLVALAFIALQAFFSTHHSKSVTELYYADRLTDAHRVLIDEFNRIHQGEIGVVAIDFPNPDFTTNERKEILARSLRGEGDGIDVFAVDPIWVQRFERWSEPLDQYFSASELDSINAEGLRSCYKDGKLVAIPFGVVQGVLLYREDLVRALPRGEKFIEALNRGITWDEFVRFGKSVQSPSPFYVFPAAEYEGLLCVFTDVLLSLQRDYFAVHGFNFETPQARKALGLLVDLVHKYNITPEAVASMTEVSTYEYFVRRNGLFMRGWTNYQKDLENIPEITQRIKMAPLPRFREGTLASTIGGWDLMVSKFSPKKQEAISFIKFILQRESQELIHTKGGFFPVVRQLYEEEVYRTKYPELIAVKQMLNHGVHRPSHEKYTRYSEVLAHYISQAIRGRMGVEEALRLATRDVESEKIIFSSAK